MLRPLPLFILLFMQLLAVNSGNDEKLSEAVKCVFGGSTRQPFTNALKENGKQTLLKELAEWFQDVSEDVRKRRQDSDGSECTLRGQDWIDKAIDYMTDRRLPKPVKSCATRTEHSNREQRKAIKLLNQAAEAFKEAGNKVKNDPEMKPYWNNNKIYAYENIGYDVDDQKCRVDYATAIRMQTKTWYIMAAVTSLPVNQGGTRNHIVEHVSSDLKAPLWLNLSRKTKPGDACSGKDEKVTPARFTTAFAETKGSARISRIHAMGFEENRALTSALQENLLAIDQAQDALTRSNFAILILPLLMSFIPVALIADVSDVATFFYVLLTDVFSAVPFVIKGVELVITGSSTIKNTETWLVGEEDSTQIAETWVASCRPLAKFKYIGIAVICAGLAAIIFGIFLEHFARKWMSLRRDMGESPEPFGPALLRMDAYIPVGANYMPADTNYDDSMAPNLDADLPRPPPAAGPRSVRVSTVFSGLLRQRKPRNGAHAVNHSGGPSSLGVDRQAESNGVVQETEYENA